MTVTPTTTTPTTNPATTASQTALGKASLADNFNTFLSLLTTQLKNQDPTAPLDSNQFTQQLVQMTGVEQQLNANDLLQQLVNNTSNGITTAVSLIGKNVKAVSDNANLNGGQAQWTYNLGAAASDLKVEVLDSNGNVVHVEAPTDMKAGDHAFTWNGKDMTGTQLPDGGTYTLRVTAKDGTGTALATTTYVQGVVTGVTQNNGATSITVNGGPVDWSKVININQVAAATPPTTTPASS